jgi:hypothetical protein
MADASTHLDTPGISQLSYMGQLFAPPRKWHDLVPDQDHAVVTKGRGRHSKSGSITTNTYATSARTSDGSLVITYMPTIRTITVDMSKLAGITTARWFDPTNGSYITADGSPFVNVGGRRFTPPGNNSAGDGDWGGRCSPRVIIARSRAHQVHQDRCRRWSRAPRVAGAALSFGSRQTASLRVRQCRAASASRPKD